MTRTHTHIYIYNSWNKRAPHSSDGCLNIDTWRKRNSPCWLENLHIDYKFVTLSHARFFFSFFKYMSLIFTSIPGLILQQVDQGQTHKARITMVSLTQPKPSGYKILPVLSMASKDMQLTVYRMSPQTLP